MRPKVREIWFMIVEHEIILCPLNYTTSPAGIVESVTSHS